MGHHLPLLFAADATLLKINSKTHTPSITFQEKPIPNAKQMIHHANAVIKNEIAPIRIMVISIKTTFIVLIFSSYTKFVIPYSNGRSHHRTGRSASHFIQRQSIQMGGSFSAHALNVSIYPSF